MTVWYSTRRMGWQAKAAIALGVLAVVLVAAVPVALVVGLIMMLLGHVVGGLALWGASIVAAGAAVVIAGLSGVKQLRKLVSQQSFRVVRLRRSDYDGDYDGDGGYGFDELR
jgi:uncharacterized membrane protein YdjX (TVP38/TMEM64 family)